MARAKISSKYQITLPKEVREGLGIEAGDELYIAREGEKVVLRPLPKVKRPTEAIYGTVKSKRDAVEAIREFRRSGGRAR
ncbi:MAG: AbrB/MazE/SpoVT family DNA-binding domain-containing protein [Hadesarchaea archaeon]|nr:AbrB/MazE/SpoVT family DNA-binding domain-containing protein [Hadesarchaea archaeon]